MLKKPATWISWVFALYFFISFQCSVGFPPKGITDDGVYLLLLLFLLFFLMPFAQSLKILGFIEYTSKVDEIKSDLKDFKTETRELFSLQSNLISSVSQNVHINLPSSSEAREAAEKLSSVEGRTTHVLHSAGKQADETMSYISDAGNDHTLALMKLRRDLEAALRELLGKTTSFQVNKRDRKYFTMTSLWKMYLAGDDNRSELDPAFRYVVDICNAAAHSQDVPQGYAEEAISMGLRILDIVRNEADS